MKQIRTFFAATILSCIVMSSYGANRTDTTVVSEFDSVPLSIMIFEPETAPKAAVQIVHGMCEYKERYIPFINYLTDNGYAVIIHDHRGHGASVHSQEDLGFFYSEGYEAMIADARRVGDLMHRRHPDVPFFLFGHSMGSMVVRSYIKTDDSMVDALVVCGSPSFNSSVGIGKRMAQTAARRDGGKSRPVRIQQLSFNSFNRKFRYENLQNAWVCSDTSVVIAYNADSLCNYQFTANGFYNLFSLMQYTYDTKNWRMSNPQMPILFISGEDDPCAGGKRKFLKAQQYMKKAGYTNVNGKMYPGMRHEILNEREKEIVWNDVLEFFNSNLTGR
ncbi:MAG: alpha/beta fold hydrolase [Candidatus Aphodosoma sp.]